MKKLLMIAGVAALGISSLSCKKGTPKVDSSALASFEISQADGVLDEFSAKCTAVMDSPLAEPLIKKTEKISASQIYAETFKLRKDVPILKGKFINGADFQGRKAGEECVCYSSRFITLPDGEDISCDYRAWHYEGEKHIFDTIISVEATGIKHPIPVGSLPDPFLPDHGTYTNDNRYVVNIDKDTRSTGFEIDTITNQGEIIFYDQITHRIDTESLKITLPDKVAIVIFRNKVLDVIEKITPPKTSAY